MFINLLYNTFRRKVLYQGGIGMEQNKRISELLKGTIGQRYDAMALKMIRDEGEVSDQAI